MTIDTYIALASLALNCLVAIATIYIAYLALVHTAKPRIEISLRESTTQPARTLVALHYDVQNRGYWYAIPPAIDVVIYTNFDPRFELVGISYGSQQHVRVAYDDRVGKRGLKYHKATGIKLIASGTAETVVLHVRTPSEPGTYHTHVSAYSPNGVSYSREIPMTCVGSNVTAPPASLDAL